MCGGACNVFEDTNVCLHLNCCPRIAVSGRASGQDATPVLKLSAHLAEVQLRGEGWEGEEGGAFDRGAHPRYELCVRHL